MYELRSHIDSQNKELTLNFLELFFYNILDGCELRAVRKICTVVAVVPRIISIQNWYKKMVLKIKKCIFRFFYLIFPIKRSKFILKNYSEEKIKFNPFFVQTIPNTIRSWMFIIKMHWGVFLYMEIYLKIYFKTWLKWNFFILNYAIGSWFQLPGNDIASSIIS